MKDVTDRRRLCEKNAQYCKQFVMALFLKLFLLVVIFQLFVFVAEIKNSTRKCRLHHVSHLIDYICIMNMSDE